MTDTPRQRQPTDGMPRDARGFWQPERGTAPANPWFSWPLKPGQALKWLFGFPGYLYPWNLLYMGIAALTWLHFQPALFTLRRVPGRLDPRDVRSQPG